MYQPYLPVLYLPAFTSLTYQHITSHQGIKYNEGADQLASGSLYNQFNPNLKDQTFREILRRRVPSNMKIQIPSFCPSRADNILYYRIKSNSLFLKKEEFTWHKQANPFCRLCNSIPESLDYQIF